MTTIKPSDINLKCAELLEPKPVHICGKPGSEMYNPQDCAACKHRGLKVVRLLYWTWRRQGFEPLDFLHDPRGTVMLLTSKTHYGFLDIIDDCDAIGIYDWSGETWLVREDLTADRSNLAEKATMAFLRANGIEVNE